MYYYKVLLDIPNTDYYIYAHSDILSPNTRVLVNLRNRVQVGIIYATCDVAQIDFDINKIKQISQILTDTIQIDTNLINIVMFLHQYYIYPLGATFFNLLPNKFKLKKEINYTPKSANKINTDFTPKLKTLTADQIIAYDKITKSDKPTILYGITGSGKTEVYLHLVLQHLKQNQQALVLYPEINLTPMLRARFNKAFVGANIVVLNSQVTNNKRLEYYQQIQDGSAQIIMGTRLSLFSPFQNLGLIIVDEEHDSSFKQDDNLPYNARNIAVWLANHYSIPIILGSATPSLSSLYNYKMGKYSLVALESRAITGASLPNIELIDSGLFKPNNAGISHPTIKAIQECIDNKQMCLIYINRRGYAPVILCNDCNYIIKCINCNSNLVLHGKTRLLCHYCGYQNTLPNSCPKCYQHNLSSVGTGTQNIEEFILMHFSTASIIRIDRDSTSSKKAWDDIYQKINDKEVDIIVGTQMLAKGHDFANLNLVVCLDVDNALYSLNYTTLPQLYATLTQVSGRAGRANNTGRVIIQTKLPNEKIFSYLRQHDFLGWVNFTLQERKLFNLPPYSYQAKIKFQSNNELELIDIHKQIIVNIMRKCNDKEIIIYNPVFDIIAKINNIYHSHMIIQSATRHKLHSYLSNNLSYELHKISNKIYFKIDVDFI